MYGGKHTYIINLGYTEGSVNKVKIFFEKGNYTIDDIIVYVKPKSQINNSIDGLKRIANNVSYSANKFEFDVKLENNANVFMSIPYTNGWKAYVNGEERDIIKTNDAFMSIPLESGEYKIQLKYFTPGLKVGFIISLISIIIFVIIIYKNKHKLEINVR